MKNELSSIIYLDNASTTPLDLRVLEEMLPYFTSLYANPGSTHFFGQEIRKVVGVAREKVAEFLGCLSNEIIFTSGATEAINLAFKGLVSNYQGNRSKIITVKTEHKAVLDTCQYLENIGFEVTLLSVQQDGLIDYGELEQLIDDQTLCVCVMLVNNETGVMHQLSKVAEVAHNCGALALTDATQAVGKIPIKISELGVDLLAFSGHKFHGPKGVGGLYVRQGVKLDSLIHGGGQEKGLISGTLNVPNIVGLAEACSIAKLEFTNHMRTQELRDYLEKHLLEVKGSFVNGNKANRINNITNISFPNIDANLLIQNVKPLAVSNGSACTSAVFQPSHVLSAMGLSTEESLGAIRFSLGRHTTKQQIDSALNILSKYLPFKYYPLCQ